MRVMCKISVWNWMTWICFFPEIMPCNDRQLWSIRFAKNIKIFLQKHLVKKVKCTVCDCKNNCQNKCRYKSLVWYSWSLHGWHHIIKKMRTRSSRCPPPKLVVCWLVGEGGNWQVMCKGCRHMLPTDTLELPYMQYSEYLSETFLVIATVRTERRTMANASTPFRCGGGQPGSDNWLMFAF